MLNALMGSFNAREDVFILGPLSHIIAREYTQMNITKQRRRVLSHGIFHQHSFVILVRRE